MDLSGSKKPHIRWRPKSPTGEGQFWEHLLAHCEVQGISGVRKSYFCRWYTSLFKISSLPCQQSCIYTESRNKDEHRLTETNQINSNCKLSYLRTNLHQQNYLSAIIIVKNSRNILSCPENPRFLSTVAEGARPSELADCTEISYSLNNS